MRNKDSRGRLGPAIVALVALSTSAAADPADDELRAQLELLIEQNRRMQQEIDALKDEVRGARDEADAAQARAARLDRTAVEGVGAGSSSMMVARVGSPRRFRSLSRS